jgi:hypothetical protein
MSTQPLPRLPALVISVVIVGCAIYANLALAVKNPADYRYFPPFQSYVNVNLNRQLGGEVYEIARSLVAGQGYANPFKEPTGPTSWAAPVPPTLVAALLRLFDGNAARVADVMVVCKTLVLVGTGILLLKLTGTFARRVSPWLVAGVFLILVLSRFRLWFQVSGDGWRVLLALDVLLLGGCWWRPLDRAGPALAWGLFGGFCALLNPVVASVWVVPSASTAARRRAWSRLALTLLAAALVAAPWMIRNYLVFGRLIPVKSNLAYELYQSQCLQPDGLLQEQTFTSHPHMTGGRERQQYKELGETRFLDRKWQQFVQAVAADPLDFLKRVSERFFGATLWYVPLNRTADANRPVVLWGSRLIHPLPFLALVVLVFFRGEPLSRAQWSVIVIYCFYLLPYIVSSFYERYALPLLGVNALLVIWLLERLVALFSTARPRASWKAEGTPGSDPCFPFIEALPPTLRA